MNQAIDIRVERHITVENAQLQAMQKRLHDYVVADKGTAKEALDSLIADWTEVFKEEGKISN